LSTKAVAAGDGDREHPQRHHYREIERRDAGAHADRLQQRMAVDTAADVLGFFALEQVRHAAGELDHLDAALHRAGRVGQGLAVLLRGEPRQFVAVLFHQLAETGEDAGTAQRRGVAPGGESGLGCRHCGIDVGSVGQWNQADQFAGGRVEHLAHAAARRLDTLTVDPEMQFFSGHRFLLSNPVSRCRGLIEPS
jgi:hypothetical protein